MKDTGEGGRNPARLSRLGRECALEWIRADTLKRDPDYQRAVRPERVAAITSKFHEHGLGVLFVSRRFDGDYLIDGQHRDQSILALGLGHREVPCIVYRNLSREQERSMFLLLNKERLPLSQRETFEARAARGENLAGSLRELMDAFGLRISSGSRLGPREIASTAALERIDEAHGEELVARTLAVLEAGWSDQEGAYRSSYLQAVAALLAEGAVDDARLAETLAAHGPRALDRMLMERLDSIGYRGHARYVALLRELCAAETGDG